MSNITNLKKFLEKSTDKNVYITKCNDKSIVYGYNGNTICYFENPSILEYPDKFFPVSELGKGIKIDNKALKSIKGEVDETPFNFDYSILSTEEMPTNKLVKIFTSFSKFYDTNSFRVTTSGVHVKKGVLFATDAFMLKLSKMTLLEDSNMVIDINPVLGYLDINSKKIKSTAKSLFKSPTLKNDSISISLLDTSEGSAMLVNNKGTKFIINSLAESSLDFSFIKAFKPHFKFKVHRKNFITTMNNLLNRELETPIDTKPNMVRFNMQDKLILSRFEYNGMSSVNDTILYSNQTEHSDNFVLDGERVANMLKEISDDSVLIEVSADKKMVRFRSEDNKHLLMLAGTTF